jgi:hypothetical protein
MVAVCKLASCAGTPVTALLVPVLAEIPPSWETTLDDPGKSASSLPSTNPIVSSALAA